MVESTELNSEIDQRLQDPEPLIYKNDSKILPSETSGSILDSGLFFFLKPLKYLFLPLPKENNVERWTREGFPYREKILNGIFSSMLGMCGTIPIDLTRQLYYMYKAWPQTAEKFVYRSGFTCLYHTKYSKSFLGMYRPAIVDICLRTPKISVKMVSNDFYGFILTSPRGEFPTLNRFMAAILTGLTQCLLSSPFEVYRYRYWQSQGYRAWYLPRRTNVEIWEQIMSPRGRRHWWLVIRAMSTESVCSSCIYFPLQNYLMKLCSTKNTRPGPWVSFVSGWCAATVALIIVTPMDNIKKQVVRIPDYTDMYPCPGTTPDYESLRQCFRRYVRQYGWAGLFNGISCRVGVKARIFGVVQLFYDLNLTDGLISKERTFRTIDDFESYSHIDDGLTW